MTVVVIFGAALLPGGRPSRTLQSRVDAAFACGGSASRYVPTGAAGRHPVSEARVMAGLLEALGVPPGQIACEETGTDTLSSARAVAAMVGAGPVRVASSGYHLPRCVLLLRMAGVQASACTPPAAGGWRWYWRLRECAALPYDAVLMGLKGRRA